MCYLYVQVKVVLQVGAHVRVVHPTLDLCVQCVWCVHVRAGVCGVCARVLRAYVCVCVRACVRACEHARVRVCMGVASGRQWWCVCVLTCASRSCSASPMPLIMSKCGE